ncbi:MAG TPA: response regulator [Thermoanaerobaculia bacterium]|nr:response regulator [Thermoanaerobaculia bacterium]
MHASRVLIADSDPHLRQLLYSALLAVDVFSDCVSTVPDALEKLRGEPYGVVLVDVGLPGGDAEQMVSAIAALNHQRPVVLVLASNPAAARSLDVDIVQIVLRKPLALRQTVELIRSCVQSAAAVAVAEDEEGDGDHVTS